MAKSGYRPFIRRSPCHIDEHRRLHDQFGQHRRIDHQTLFDGFQTRNNVRAAEAQVFAGRENLRGTEIDILLATVQAYANVNRDNQIVVYRKQNIAFLQEQFSAARARFDVGESTRTDVSLAEAELAGAGKPDGGHRPGQIQRCGLCADRRLVPRNLKPVRCRASCFPLRSTGRWRGDSEHPAVLAALYGVDAAGYTVKSAGGLVSSRCPVSGSVSEADGGVSTARFRHG
jgi:outer membrane protein